MCHRIKIFGEGILNQIFRSDLFSWGNSSIKKHITWYVVIHLRENKLWICSTTIEIHSEINYEAFLCDMFREIYRTIKFFEYESILIKKNRTNWLLQRQSNNKNNNKKSHIQPTVNEDYRQKCGKSHKFKILLCDNVFPTQAARSLPLTFPFMLVFSFAKQLNCCTALVALFVCLLQQWWGVEIN